MSNFLIVGSIADVDLTTPEDSFHPALVIIVESDHSLQKIVLPNHLLGRDLTKYAVGAQVRIIGRSVGETLRDFRFVATEIKVT